MPTQVVAIDFAVGDTADSLCALLSRLGGSLCGSSAHGAAPVGDLHIDFTDCSHLGPMGAAILLAQRQAFEQHGRRLTLSLPTSPALAGFFRFSGLVQAFQLGPGPDDHPDNVTAPARTFTTVDLTAVESVMRLVRRFAGLDEDREDEFRTVMLELMNNALDHAGSAAGQVLCARALVKKRMELRISIYDTGVGVRTTLARHHQVRSDRDALRLAVEEGVSGQTLQRNMGLGLPLLREIARNREKSQLLLASGNAVVTASRQLRFWDTSSPLPGTLAMVRLSVDL